jgi:hypothetical protein
VENWHASKTRQYLQVIAMIEADHPIANTQDLSLQLRYILGGLKEPPYSGVRNVRYIMADPPSPSPGEWVHFKTNVAKDFLRQWGWIPRDFEKFEIFYELRYDDPIPPGESASADVYADDFFLSP